jgi:broad specificity phosphatase PhoE
MKPITLYLLRHGESELNFQRIFAGPGSDPALTLSGSQQAALQAASLKNTPFSAIYSSPSLRARQTAQILGEGRDLDIHISDHLREVDIGRLDGQSIDDPEILATYRDVISKWQLGDQAAGFPGGERLMDVKTRFRDFLEALHENDMTAPILIAGHGILFMAALWLFVKDRSSQLQDYYMNRCHLTIVTWDGRHMTMEKLNIPPQPGTKSESALA